MWAFVSQSWTVLLTEQLWNSIFIKSASGHLDRFEASDGKGNSFTIKLERSVLTNFFVMCTFISQSWTLLFIEQFWNTLFVEFESGPLDCFEAYVGKGNIFTHFYIFTYWSLWWKRYLHIKTSQNILKTLFAIRAFISQSWTLLLIEQFERLFLYYRKVDNWSALRPIMEN